MGIQTGTWTNSQADRKINRQEDKQTGRQTDRSIDIQEDRETDERMDKQKDRQIDKQTDRQTERQTDRWINVLVYRRKDRQKYGFYLIFFIFIYVLSIQDSIETNNLIVQKKLKNEMEESEIGLFNKKS